MTAPKHIEEEQVRVLRIVEYIGPRSWVEYTVERSIHGEKFISGGGMIRTATLGCFPEIIERPKMDEHWLRGAVARAWCTPENENKEMDTALAEAIVKEIMK